MKTKEDIQAVAENKYGTSIESIRGGNPYDIESDRKNGYVQGYLDAQFSSDPYSGELNTKRIRAYKVLAQQYNISELTVGKIFCEGIDWYLKEIKK